MTNTFSRRSLLRGATAVPLGAVLSPAIIGKARAAAMKMRISSSQQNDPKFANGRVYFDNLLKARQSRRARRTGRAVVLP